MNLKEQINVDFIKAFKAKEMERKNFLGLLKSEIQNEEGRGTVTTDGTVLIILRKMEKALKLTNNSESLVELSYMEPYLPSLMTEEQIRTIVKTYKDAGLTNAGQMMGLFSRDYKGLADNKLVSTIISEV